MATVVSIRGLDDRGFRIKNSGGSPVVVKRGTSVLVDVDDHLVARELVRHNDDFIRSAGATVQIRGLTGATPFADFRAGATAVSNVTATGTLTSDATAPANNDTVTIGAKTYTFKTTLTGAANEVLIGSTANASAALTNLKAAINASAGAGSTYGTGTTANAQATAGTLTPTTLVLTSVALGAAGNSVATTETSAHLSFGATTLTGGVTAIAAGTQFGVKPGSSTEINVDDQENTRKLRRNKSRYIVGSSNLISIKGLDHRGVRIKDSGGTWRMLKLGGSAYTVNVNDRATANILSRNASSWIEA